MAKGYSTGSAKVSGCEKCCYQFNVFLLQAINFIDFSMGVVLIAFFAFLYEKLGAENTSSQATWLEYSCGGLGILFILESFLGCCAIVSEGCRFGMVFARWLSYLLAILCLALGSAAFGEQKTFFNFLDNQLNGTVSSETINSIKTWFLIISISLEQSRKIDGEFGNLMAEEEQAYKTRLAENQSTRSEKYNDLKSFYKNKYSNKNNNTKDLEKNPL